MTIKTDIRVDAPAKLAGTTRYIRDEKIEGMWFGTTVRSPHAHARIIRIDFDPAFDWNRVVTITAADVPVNYVAMLEKDMPFLAENVAKYVGDPIVLIAGADKDAISEAKRHVKITYQPLPAIFNMLEWLRSGSAARSGSADSKTQFSLPLPSPTGHVKKRIQ